MHRLQNIFSENHKHALVWLLHSLKNSLHHIFFKLIFYLIICKTQCSPEKQTADDILVVLRYSALHLKKMVILEQEVFVFAVVLLLINVLSFHLASGRKHELNINWTVLTANMQKSYCRRWRVQKAAGQIAVPSLIISVVKKTCWQSAVLMWMIFTSQSIPAEVRNTAKTACNRCSVWHYRAGNRHLTFHFYFPLITLILLAFLRKRYYRKSHPMSDCQFLCCLPLFFGAFFCCCCKSLCFSWLVAPTLVQ